MSDSLYGSGELSEIAHFNQALHLHLQRYIRQVEFRFDEPDPKNLPAVPTFYLFMSQIAEDLSVRPSVAMTRNPVTGVILADSALIQCRYLVVYWDGLSGKNSDSPRAMADNQAVSLITEMVRVLRAMRNVAGFSSYRLRLIEPEAHTTLSDIWQAFDNKPRTLINFAVTMPLRLTAGSERSVPPVKYIDTRVDHLGDENTDDR